MDALEEWLTVAELARCFDMPECVLRQRVEYDMLVRDPSRLGPAGAACALLKQKAGEK